MIRNLILLLLAAALTASSVRNNQARRRTSSSSSSSSSSGSSSEERDNGHAHKIERAHLIMPHIHFESWEQVQAYSIAEAMMMQNLTKERYTKQSKHSSMSRISSPPIGSEGSGDDVIDRDIYVKKAVQFWTQKEFVRLFKEFNLKLTQNEIAAAKSTFDNFKYEQFESKGKSGIIVILDNDKLKAVVDLWQQEDLLTTAEASALKISIDSQQTKQDQDDIGHTRSNGDIIFGRLGYISLQVKKSDPPSGTIIYMFRKFHFNLALDVSIVRSQKCYVWGIFCETSVNMVSSKHQLTGEESTNLSNFMKYQTAQDYDASNGPYIQYLIQESDRYARFAPKEFRDDWQKIDALPDGVPPETVLPNKNALDPANYSLD